MIIYYRLSQQWHGLPEGSVIAEAVYKDIYYTDKALWEVICEEEIKDMVKHEDEGFCAANGIEFLLFYNQRELDKFLNGKFDAAIID